MADIQIRLHEIEYQRNGISGEGFYQARFDWKEPGEQWQKDFIATFRPLEIKTPKGMYSSAVDIESTRVVDPLDLSQKWRGDHFGYALNRTLQDLLKTVPVDKARRSHGLGPSFYDLIGQYPAKKQKSLCPKCRGS